MTIIDPQKKNKYVASPDYVENQVFFKESTKIPHSLAA